MKRANHGTKLQGTPKQEKTATAPQTGKNPNDARDNEEQLVENQQELGVGEDHKTEDMEKADRGTFP